MSEKQSIFPEMDIIPGVDKIRAVGAFLGRLVRFLPLEAPEHMSSHYHAQTGASAMLDESLYGQEQS